MAITVEELEILISVQKEKATKDLDDLRKKLEETFSKAIPRMQQSAKQVQQAVQSMNPSVQAAASQVKSATDQMISQFAILDRQIELQRKKWESLQSTLASTGNYASQDKLKLQIEAASISLDKLIEKQLSMKDKMTGAGVAEPIKKSVEKAIPQVKKLSNELQATAKRGKTVFEQLGITIGRAFKFAVIYKSLRAMFDFIKQGIQSAINAPEIENMFRVAFAAGADEAAKFAEALRAAYGIDPYVSKQMLGTFQNMATAMGTGTRNAAEMSKGLTLLANDMASLYNVDPQQAAENLQSALSGQGRAVRKYGYIILDSTIKETAYRLGIAQTGAELTEQQKVLARYMTLQEQSKNAHGDLERTLGNVANQLRILKQNIVAAGRSIGTAFIPFIQAATPFLNGFFILLQRIGDAMATFTFGLFGKNFAEWKKEQEAIIGGTGDMSQAEDEYADSVDKAAKAQKGLLSGFDKLNISQRKGSGAGGITGDGGFDIPETEAPKGQSPFEKMADSLQASLEKIKASFEPFITNVGNSFKWFFDNVLMPLKDYTVNNLLPTFFEALAAVLNSPVWATVGEQIAKIYKDFLQPVAAWAGEEVVKLFGWIKDNGDLVAKAIIAIGIAFLTWKAILLLDKAAGIIIAISTALKGISFATIGTFAASILPSLAKGFGWIGTVAFPKIAAAIGTAITALATFLGVSVGWAIAIVAAVVGAVVAIVLNWDKIKVFFTKTLPAWWNSTVIPFFQNMWAKLTEGISAAIEWAISKWDAFYTFISDILTKAMDRVKEWGVNLVNWATVEVPKFVNTAINFLKELPSKIWNIGRDMIASLWEGMQSMIGWLGDKVGSFIDGIVEGFSDGFSGKSIDVNVKQKNTSSYNIPRLANGGVLTAPRLVMGGEYAGARSNPEIVTPQSLMYETSLKAQQTANQPLVAIMGQVLQAIKDGKVIELDGYELGRQVDRIHSNNNMLLGI